MDSWFCWFHLWMLLTLLGNILVESASPRRYAVQRGPVSFDEAVDKCSPGTLTTIATEQEAANILRLISESPSNQRELTFWVGLRKLKNECVFPSLPLRGFKWIQDGSKETQVSHWMEEPEHTCTSVRCAAMKVYVEGSGVIRWGLIPVTCRNSYQFICKLRDPQTAWTPEPPKPAQSATELEPATSEPKPATPEPYKPVNKSATQNPDQVVLIPELPTREQKAQTELTPGSEPASTPSHPVLGSDSCQRPLIPSARFLTLDPDNSSRIQVECWSFRVELKCSGRPAVWRLLDNSPANFTTFCQPCVDGFKKDASGHCEDIDECSGTPCRYTCLNTEGSYRCICSDQEGKHHDEDSSACMDTATDSDNSLLSGVLIPVLVAVAALVVLMLLVAVTVKCCLLKRSKKRAMKKAEKMAMKSKDDKENVLT